MEINIKSRHESILKYFRLNFLLNLSNRMPIIYRLNLRDLKRLHFYKGSLIFGVLSFLWCIFHFPRDTFSCPCQDLIIRFFIGSLRRARFTLQLVSFKREMQQGKPSLFVVLNDYENWRWEVCESCCCSWRPVALIYMTIAGGMRKCKTRMKSAGLIAQPRPLAQQPLQRQPAVCVCAV